MAKSKVVDLRFPVGGLFKRSSYQSLPPFTSPDCCNTRPIDSLQGRERGGSRPGLSKAYDSQLGSGNPVRMLGSVAVVENDGYTFTSDNFKGASLGDAWAVSHDGTLPSIADSNFASITYNTAAGANRSAIANIKTTSPYEIQLFCCPYLGQYWGKYRIYARMAASSPAATTAGIIAELVMNDAVGTYSGTLKVYAASVLTNTYTFTGGATGSADAGWFSVYIDGNDITCKWLGNTLLSAQTVSAAAGSRVGFGFTTTGAGGLTMVDTFRVMHKTTNNNQCVRRPLIASSNGLLYRETRLGTLEASGATLTLNSDRELHMAERAQKAYIADNGNPLAYGTDGVRGTGNTKLDSATYTDWTTLGANVNDYVVVISSSAGGGAVDGTYQLSAIASGELTLSTAWCTGGGATCSFRLERAPKIYDPVANTLTLWTATTSLGQVPTGCPVIGRYRDRILLAGAPVAPHVWYFSRQSNPLDWDYSASATDGGRAVAGTSADAGTVGEPILAFIPHGDDYGVFGCENSLWLLRGDPAVGGSVDNLSRTVGIVSKGAWCWGPSGEIIFLSRDGIYMLPPGGGPPQSISRERMPRELLDFDNTMYTVLLQYSVRDRGVHIYLTPIDYKAQKHYFFDWQDKGFWPESLIANHEPHSIHAYSSTSAEDSAVLLGCRDGYIRRYHYNNETDDGTTFSNYVVYGPLRLGYDDYTEGMVSELFGVIGANSGTVTWSAHMGETHEAALSASAFATGTLSAGINFKVHPRARGASFYLKLTGATYRRWSVERMGALIRRLGKQRLA